MDEDEQSSSGEDEADDELEPIAAERKRRQKIQKGNLRRTAGEPTKPKTVQVQKLQELFLGMLRNVLSE